MKELLKEVEKAGGQISAVVHSKETVEHRLGMAKQEVQFQNSRIQQMEADNTEMSGEVESTRTSLQQLEHDLR